MMAPSSVPAMTAEPHCVTVSPLIMGTSPPPQTGGEGRVPTSPFLYSPLGFPWSPVGASVDFLPQELLRRSRKGLNSWSPLTQALHCLPQHLRVPIIVEVSCRLHGSSQLWMQRGSGSSPKWEGGRDEGMTGWREGGREGEMERRRDGEKEGRCHPAS